MRSLLFNIAYWALSITYGLAAAFAALAPGRKATSWIIRRYVRRMVQAMSLFAGIRIETRGKERLPQGAFIIASKHQSWGDGFATYDQFDDLAFVTGDHLEKFPLLGTVLKKLGAIVVNNCGGHAARAALKERAADANREGRKILIYPEGHLARVGEKFRYRSGVWHMYRDFDMPVVPLATNLGLFWPLEDFHKTPARRRSNSSNRSRQACRKPSSWTGWKPLWKVGQPNLSPKRQDSRSRRLSWCCTRTK